MTDEDLIYTVTELCARWKCDRHTVLSAIRDGRLAAFRLGKRSYRITRESVRQCELEKRRVA